MALRSSTPFSAQVLTGLLASATSLLAIACGSTSSAPQGRVTGQSEFGSVAPGAAARGEQSGDLSGNASTAAPAASDGAHNAGAESAAAPRKVEETDLYRLEGDRLYYLNAYRGLMVFDVSNVDAPKLLGRSPIYGSPVEMIVRNGIASVVVADWYGTDDKNEPFYGSIVRGIDATDPSHMKVLSDARLGGWVRDTRVVGDVLYAVTEDYGGGSFGGYYNGLEADGALGSYSPGGVSIASVNIAGGKTVSKGRYQLSGQGGIFNVTADSILLAHNVVGDKDKNGYQAPTGATELVYIDISDPQGTIRPRGTVSFNGYVQGWGADNGRWNLDFADGKTAHALGCAQAYCDSDQPFVLATADFSNPDQPSVSSVTTIPATGWGATARFDSGRMYLTPGSSYYYGNQAQPALPLQIWDLADPKRPVLAGATQLAGEVWNLIPAGDRLFALGNEYLPGMQYTSSQVSLRYIDVTDPTQPQVIGTSKFGDGWAWTPAAGTFKAFTLDKSRGMVVLPFSGWDNATYQYNNGLQLIEFSDQSLKTAGAAKANGWTERGIFVKNRLLSLSDLALSVVDYTDHMNPKLVHELTLARNVVNVRPLGNSLAELSTDWWGNDSGHSTLRILPVSEVGSDGLDAASDELDVPGQNAQTFHNGNLAYVVSTVCASIEAAGDGQKGMPCSSWTQEVQVIDYSTGKIQKRGVIDLPAEQNGYYSYGGFYGCFWYDWYNGGDVVQVGKDALAFRRWTPNNYGSGVSQQLLYMVDLSDADAPQVASTVITSEANGWWGNLRTVGDQLYASHYEWERSAQTGGGVWDPGVVRYYVDRVDYSDRAHPHIGQKINVPGLLVGASASDPSLIYTVDYRWTGDNSVNEFDVLKLSGDKAYLQSSVQLPGWVGSTFVRGNRAYMSGQDFTSNTSEIRLIEIDLSDPKSPRVLSSPAKPGWGWLVGVEGDRALVSSGWGNQGIDVYRLSETTAPSYERFIRVRGWGVSSLSRQNDQLFLSSGYWGTEVVDLDH